MKKVKLIIEIDEITYNDIKRFSEIYDGQIHILKESILKATPLPNVTDEQISNAFQVAIANYWESKSKCLTPPPVPCCDCQNIGHWIDDKCSVCGKGIEDLIDSREWYRNEEPNFCPFCGTKMLPRTESEKG